MGDNILTSQEGQNFLLFLVLNSKMLTKSVRFLKNIAGIRPISAAQQRLQSTEASFEVNNPYKVHLLDETPSTTVSVTRDEALKYYREMFLIRRMETAAGNLYKEKAIRGFCHLCSGQEAIYVGIANALREHDSVITSYRAHGFTYVRGISVLGVLSELTGRSSGCVRGKGGS